MNDKKKTQEEIERIIGVNARKVLDIVGKKSKEKGEQNNGKYNKSSV